MKKNKSIISIFGLSILFISLFITNVNALVDPTSEFYVNDYANILSQETEEYIVEKSKELYRVDGTQIVVVTVKNLEGQSLEEYSLDLARYFGIGSKEKNNGLLLLLALEERQSRVEVGTGLEGILPDGKTGRFQDEYMIPFFKQNDFDTGIRNGYDAFFNEIVTLNNLNLDMAKLQTLENEYHENAAIYVMLFCGIGAAIGALFKITKITRKIITPAYFIVGGVILYIYYISKNYYFVYVAFHLFGFLLGRFANVQTRSSGAYTYSGSSSSSYSSSSSSSSGGGGGFSGGGSSRGF